MNARQKAKKYKKYIEKLENEVAIYRITQRAEEFRRATEKRRFGTLETFKIEESNFSTEQYKADLQGAYDCGYNCGYTDAMNDIAESEDEE